jgi:hypothetical protein
MNEDFKSKLREMAKSPQEIEQNTTDLYRRSAQSEYNRLKDEMIKYVSTHGCDEKNGKKVVTYYYIPSSIEAKISHYSATHSVKKVFRTSYIRYTAYGPSDEKAWKVYIEEITKLAKADDISITPVLFQHYPAKLEAPFPLSTCDRDWTISAGITLRLKCVAEIE